MQIILIPRISKSIDHNAGLFGAKPTVDIFGTKSTVDTTPTAGFSFGAAFAPPHSQVSAMVKRSKGLGFVASYRVLKYIFWCSCSTVAKRLNYKPGLLGFIFILLVVIWRPSSSHRSQFAI